MREGSLVLLVAVLLVAAVAFLLRRVGWLLVSLPRQGSATRKVVINARHGGFGVSKGAARQIRARGCEHGEDDPSLPDWREAAGKPLETERFYGYGHRDARGCPTLVAVVEEMGKAAWGDHAELRVVEIPADVEWTIEEYDGREWIAEKHRTWA